MYNNCTLIGRLARDPELRQFEGGSSICKLRLITSQSWRDKATGEMKERSEGHNVSIYVPGLSTRIAERAAKGDILLVVGQLETRRWTASDGQVRYSTEVSIRPYAGSVRRLNGSARRPAQSETSSEHALSAAAISESDLVRDISDAVDHDVFDDWLSADTGGFALDDFADEDPDA